MGDRAADSDLLRRLRGGDEAAMSVLYRRYQERILRYFRRMLGTQEAAEDALQELFLKVIDGADGIEPSRDFCTWLFAAAHHMCCNEYRARQVRLRAADRLRAQLDAAVAAVTPERGLDDAEFRRRLWAELARLAADQRSTFLLRHQEGLSLQQIATVAGVPVGTVKSRLHAVCQRLAERLRPFGSELLQEDCDDRLARQR